MGRGNTGRAIPAAADGPGNRGLDDDSYEYARDTCLELKRLKEYLQGFRDRGIFYEDVTNMILNDLVHSCQPKWMVVESSWSTRGGISSVITARHGEPPPGVLHRG